MKKLYILRHAPVILPAGICYGALNIPAKEQETKKAAEEFTLEINKIKQNFIIISSPLTRCLQLADEIKKITGHNYKISQNIAEMDFGKWENTQWDKIPREEFDKWMNDFTKYKFGEKENVENFILRIKKQYQEYKKSDKTQIWITHAGVAKATILISQNKENITKSNEWPENGVELGKFIIIK